MQIGNVAQLVVQFFTQHNDGAASAMQRPLAVEIREIANDPRALGRLGQRRQAEVQSLLSEARASLGEVSQARIDGFAASLLNVQTHLFTAVRGGGQASGSIESAPAYSPPKLPAYSQDPHPGERILAAGLPRYSEIPPVGHRVLEHVHPT
jgi:hypothetical protein